MMFLRTAALALAMLALSEAHPGGLECGTDATTRLQIGATVMSGPVTAGDSKSDKIKVKTNFKSKTGLTVNIHAHESMYFAVRVGDGLKIVVDAPNGKKGAQLNMTANCSNQAFSVPPVNQSSKTSFDYEFQVVGGTVTANTAVTVGYSSTGPKGIKLLTTGTPPAPPAPPGPAPAPPSTCAATEFCCPDAKACLTPTGTSCSKDANACDKGQICCPFTKECVTASHPCTPNPTCKATEFCCPDAKHCLTPVAPGTMCDPSNKSACPSPQVCCPLIKQCVSVGDACDPSAAPAAFMEM